MCKAIRSLMLLLAASTQACAGIGAAPGSKIFTAVPYVDHAPPRQQFDIAVPPVKGDEALPLLVYIHGGAWEAGTRMLCPFWPLTKRGYVVASIDYRFSTEAIWPAQLDDCRAALQYIVDHAKEYHVDPTRIAVTGDSAGGHLALMLGLAANDSAVSPAAPATQPAYQIRCVVDFYGPTDLTKLEGPFPGGNPVDKLLGGKIADHLDLAKDASPLYHVDSEDPPTLILHGDRDNIVPVSQSYQLAARMKREKAPCDLIIVTGGGHGGSAFMTPAKVAEIEAFIDKYEKQ